MDYSGNEFKALVFEYMSKGNLEKRLHSVTVNGDQQTISNLIQRLNIALDIASAIHYLHDHCEQLIIHCDLKPSNVLINKEIVAHVSDLRLAKMISNTARRAQSGFKEPSDMLLQVTTLPTSFL